MENLNEQPKDNSAEVSKWLKRISAARKWRDDYAKKHRWDELVQEYKGKFDGLLDRHDIQIMPINLIFAYVKTELPALYLRDPHIKINPKNRTSIQTAKVLEIVINYIWHYKRLKREVKKAIIDALVVGHAWFKTGYTGEFGAIEDNTGNVIEHIESEDFFGYFVPWKNILFDSDSIDPPYDCSWISHCVYASVDDLKNNPRYKNVEKLQVGYEAKDMGVSKASDEPEDKHAGKVRIEEVWDLKSKKVFTVADGLDDFLEDPKEWPYQMRGYPFSFLRFNFSNDAAFGISDVAAFEPQILELIKVRSMGLDHLKRFNRQMMVDDSVNDDEINKLTQGITGACIRGDLTRGDLVRPIAYPPIQTDIYAIEERIKEDLLNVSGQTATERGALQKTSTRTMGELNAMQSGAANRRSEKVDLVEDFVEDIAGNLIALLKQFVDEPYYVRVLGPQSPELQAAIQERASGQQQDAMTGQQGFTFTAEDIEGEFDVEAVAGSSTPIDKRDVISTLMQMFELAPKAGAIPGGPFVAGMTKLLIEQFDMPELEVAMEQEAQAQMQQKQMQQEQMEEAKQMSLAKEASKVAMDIEKTGVKQNKASTEYLKVLLDAAKDEPRGM
jgi:hypothetical protein